MAGADTVALLRGRRDVQAQEQAAAPVWETATYGGEPVSLAFTSPTGGLVLRQTISKIVKQAAKTAGITADLGTHAGRRTVVTTRGNHKASPISRVGVVVK